MQLSTINPIVLPEVEKKQHSSYKLFLTGKPKTNQYLFDREEMVDWEGAYKVKKNKKSGREFIQPIHIPFPIDTEFYTPLEPLNQIGRIGLTTQIKGIHPDAPKAIFLHPLHAREINKARINAELSELPVIQSDWHLIDYLNACGLDTKLVKTKPEEVEKLPKCYQSGYAHFATAELNMFCSGSFKDELAAFVKSGVLKSRRRVIIENKSGKGFGKQKTKTILEDYFEFQYHAIEINGIKYAIRLRIIDTCAIHGVSSYSDIAKTVGWELKHKDKFNSDEKSKMLETALARPADFEDYSLGDLDVYEILNAYDSKWREVYELLGIADYYHVPKLTIGGTVKDLFLAKLANKLGIADLIEGKSKLSWQKQVKERVIDKYLTFNPSNIRQWFNNTRVLLTKVEGGRCRNNRPTDIFVCRKFKGKYDANLICDIDISGCYGEGQRNQLFAIGKPEIYDHELSNDNEYTTLRQWLEQYGVNTSLLARKNREDWVKPENWGELVAGLWCARFRTSEQLKYSQDFFASWFTTTGYGLDLMAKFIKENQASDSEMVDKLDLIDFDEEYGTLKIFEQEIHNGVLTHDGLQWILAIASDRQRNELLDKIVILSSAVYPRSQEVKPSDWSKALNELDAKYENWQGKNTTTKLKDGTIRRDSNSCHAWFSINLGELIVDELLIERKKAQITHGKKSPLDLLFKLCVNTLYGDMVSKYFSTSNPVVGNNITARARALAWYMEKGFNGWQSITDGCGFLLNKVLKRGRDLIDGELTISNREKKLAQRMISETTLGDAKEITAYWDEEKKLHLLVDGLEVDNSWIDIAAMEHLQNTFTCVDVLHNETTGIKVNKDLTVDFKPRTGQFSFETKDVYRSGGFHGSANYAFENPNGTTIKMRGYELKRTHEGWIVDGETISECDLEAFVKTGRYGKDNNPGKDFMKGLLVNPEKIQRQEPAIKEGILKIAEYQDCTKKYDALGLQPGDNIKKLILMQEFSLTQFTFKTYEQFIGWKKVIEKSKDKNSQSLEGFFLNSDGTLNFKRMVDWVHDAISRGVINPYLELDSYRHKDRASKDTKKPKVSTTHPARSSYEKIKKQLSK